MIHSCLVCDKPATRVCAYPYCDNIRFICGDKCKDNENKAELLHTHHGRSLFTPYGDFINIVVQNKQIQNPFVDALRKKKATAQVHFRKGLLQISVENNFSKAIQEFLKASKIFPHERKYLNQVTKIMKAAHDYQKDDARKHFEKAKEHFKNSAIEDAIAEVTQALEMDEDYDYLYFRGRMFANLYLYDYALEDFKRGLQLNDKAGPHFNFCKGFSELRLGDFKNALVSMSRAVELDKENPLYWNERGNIFCILKMYKQAFADFQKAIELDSDNAGYYYNRGLVYYKVRNYKKALVDYTKAISLLDSFGDYYCNRGLVYFELKEYDEALKDYNKAISLDDKHVLYWQNRGNVYHDLEDYQQAIHDYGKAIEVSPDNDRCYSNRGNSYRLLGEFRSAILDYNKAIQLNPEQDQYFRIRGQLYGQMKDIKNALRDFTKAISLNDKNGAALYQRSQLYIQIGQFQKAIDDLTVIIGKSSELHRMRAFCYIELNKYDKAEADVKKAIQLSESDTTQLIKLMSIIFNKKIGKIPQKR